MSKLAQEFNISNVGNHARDRAVQINGLVNGPVYLGELYGGNS